MSSLLVAIGLGCLALGVVIDAVWGVSRTAVRLTPYVLGLAGSACFFILGVHATISQHAAGVDLAEIFGLGHNGLRIDRLSGLFLTLLFGLAVAVSACFVSWARPEGRRHRRGTATGYLLLLGAVAVIVCARDAFTFLFAWESLTLSFYMLTAVPRDRKRTGASWSTVGMGRVSGAALLFAFLLLAGHAGSLTLARWHAVGPGATHDVAWALVVAGFGAKLGLVPFQVWMPVGYPAAPGPARAAMGGIAANVAVYGLWRFLGILGRPPVWLVIIVLLAGGVTALLGIVFAAVQGRLARVIAYSSVENAGLITTAYGVALTGAVIRSELLMAMGLLAATLQVVAHAIAKSALFSSMANMEASVGTDDLDVLRGVGRRMPWSGASFGAGAVALAGLPPTIGFVSEWFILEALMQQFRLPGLALRLALAGAGALVALTTGVAALTFLRVLGLTVLGRPTPSVAERARETGALGKAGLAALIAGCLGVAAVSPWEVRYIALGLEPLVPRGATTAALKSPWVLQPVFAGFSILSPSWLWIAMPTAFLAVLAMALVLSRGRYLRVRRVPAWHSATSGVSRPAAYTAFGFANPLRRVLGNVLGTRRAVTVVDTAEDGRMVTEVSVVAETTVVEPIEAYLYRPLRAGTLALARLAKRLQSGNLNAYVAYMLIALLIALAVTAALQ